MLAEAKQLGVVRIAIEHNTTTTLELADRLVAKFELKEAQVAPAPRNGSNADARRAVGIVAAAFSCTDRVGKSADHSWAWMGPNAWSYGR